MISTHTPDWNIPVYDPPCGARELAQAVLSWRHWIQEQPENAERNGRHQPTAISDQNIDRMLRLAECASCIPNEGRYPKFTILVRNSMNRGAFTEIVRLRVPQMLTDPRQLTELAMICPELNDYALLIDEYGDTLFLQGIVNTQQGLALTAEGETPESEMRGMVVKIEGPGRLRVREMDAEIQLVAGRVRTNVGLHDSRRMKAWMEELREQSFCWCRSQFSGTHEGHHSLGWNLLVSPAWTYLLSEAADVGHGGAIVVVPDPNTPLLDVKVVTENASVLEQSNDLMLHYCRAKSDSAAPEDIQSRVSIRHGRLFALMQGLAQLTVMDGCVVFDRKLELHGFGAKISADEAARRNSRQFVLNDNPSACTEQDIIVKFGTRHRSAYNLCKAIPGTLAFVLSQDGGVRVFSSDEQTVYLDEHLTPL